MSLRQDSGIEDIKNGEHRLLQKQIDLLQDDVHYIRENIPDVVEANTRSKTNFKLICLLVAGVITLAGATVVTAVF